MDFEIGVIHMSAGARTRKEAVWREEQRGIEHFHRLG